MPFQLIYDGTNIEFELFDLSGQTLKEPHRRISLTSNIQEESHGDSGTVSDQTSNPSL